MSFSFKGCIIKIDFLFIFMLAVYALTSAEDLLLLLLFSSLHEAGHLIVLFICGGRAKKLSFSYYGFALKYDDTLSRLKETLVIAGGPGVNLLLYIILKDDINLILLFLNLLPIYPLDGGRILRLYLGRASKAVSIIFLAAVYAISLYLLIFEKSFSPALIALYLTVYSLCY